MPMSSKLAPALILAGSVSHPSTGMDAGLPRPDKLDRYASTRSWILMKSMWFTSAAMALCIGAAQASDLNVSVRTTSGQSLIRIAPGGAVPYVIQGELSNASSGGLAMFALDLSFTGGALAQAATPTVMPMLSFTAPMGFVNPAGYGGTLSNGHLLQIGGAQNTIHNTIAPTPNGAVTQNVAQPGAPVILAAGVLNAPYHVGDFTLDASNVLANVLLPGQTGVPFWKVEQAGPGALSSLTVRVQSIRAMSSLPLSASAQDSVGFSISAGPANAGRTYIMLGSLAGTSPGLSLPGGMTLPLTEDRYTQYTQHVPNSPVLSNSMGVLDAAGHATVTFHPIQRFEGHTVWHAFYLVGPTDFVSEAVSVQVVH